MMALFGVLMFAVCATVKKLRQINVKANKDFITLQLLFKIEVLRVRTGGKKTTLLLQRGISNAKISLRGLVVFCKIAVRG